MTALSLDFLAKTLLEEVADPELQDQVLRELEAAGKGPQSRLGQLSDRLKRERMRRGLARDAIITSAVPLSDKELAAVRASLERRWGVHVALETRTDPSLIGGFQVSSHDWLYDASVKGRLKHLADAMKA